MDVALTILASIVLLIVLYLGWLVFFSARTAAKVEKYLPPLGKFVEVNGERMHYLDRGEGPAIVMIHGLSGQMRHFTYAMQERLDNDFRLIIIDRPGCGYSTRKSDDAARVTEQAKTIAALIKKLDLGQPLVVGHSLGGAVSLALAVNHPESVGGLSLVAPLTQPKPEDFKIPEAFKAVNIPSPFMRNFISWTFAIPGIIKNRDAALQNVFGPDEVPDDMATKGGGLLSLRPKAFYTACTDFLASSKDLPDMMPRYSSINVPVGVIYGTRDQILNFENEGVKLKEQIPGLDLELLDGSGHMIPMTEPDLTARFIRRMASKVWSPGAKVANLNS